MTEEQKAPDVRQLGLEPSDLDGHTLEELATISRPAGFPSTRRSRARRGASSHWTRSSGCRVWGDS